VVRAGRMWWCGGAEGCGAVQTDALRWLVVPMTKSAQRGVVWPGVA
jgi:hypothetical protein